VKARLRTLGPLVRDIEPAVKDLRIENTVYGDLVRPERLPKPTCEVWLICGPPASGKSTFVRANSKAGDIVIDLDTIAREYGLGRERPSEATAMLLLHRNDRFAALATEPPERVAWVIMGGASEQLRQWWCSALGVEPDHLILLVPPREELQQRIMNDPDRRSVRHLHMWLVDKWFMQDA
jgi:5-methylcytosine-specific restriction protein A